MTTGLGEILPGRIIDTLSIGSGGGTAVAVASTGTAYGQSFPVFRGVSFAFAIKLGGSGTKSVKVELEQGNARPGTEGSSDSNWAVPDNKAPIFANIADTNIHINAYSPVATGFARLKYTGLGANDASTTVTTAQIGVTKNV